jgi:monoamine oxidase
MTMGPSMTRFPPDVDVAVVGAGSAGIGAARRLLDAGRLSVIVIEARERVGGRVWTVQKDQLPLDLGGEWLHSADRNPLVRLAEERGFSVCPEDASWTTLPHISGQTKEAAADWINAREGYRRAIHGAAQEVEDRSAASVLAPGGRWNELLDAESTWVNAVELEHLSVQDSDRYEDTGVNWRLFEGYGALMTLLAEDLPVVLAAPVSRVDHHGKRVRIDTARGTVAASRVIVTVATALIAGERLRFEPPLPEKLEAASGLPLGLVNKLFLRFDGVLPSIEDNGRAVGSLHRRETMNYQVRPFGRPLIRCIFGGNFAAELEWRGVTAMAAFAADELTGLFGAEIRRHIDPLAASSWRRDKWACGSYSYALPGHAGDRAVLAAPVDDRIFFAGEACSPNFFSTVHGAFESGFAAAEAVLRSLGRQ